MHEVVYFDFGGRGEVTRILLHAAGVPFKDTRLQGPEWMAFKPTAPLGTIPVLKIEEDTFCQSVALARYSGKLAGFYPSDPFEGLIVDEALDSLNEMLSKWPMDSDEELKKKNRQEFQAGYMTSCAKLLESRIQKYGGGKGVVSSPSVADLLLLVIVKAVQSGFFEYNDVDFFDAYPGIIATCAAIEKNEKVVSYYASLKK